MSNANTENAIPPMIGCAVVAKILGVSTRTVWRLTAKNQLPAPLRFGRNVRWRRIDIEHWIESQRRLK